MVFSKYELDCRDFVFNKVQEICSRSGAVVYGSFATANFHLNVEKWESLSDVDLIANIDNGTEFRKDICSKIESKTGLHMKVSVRKNSRHVANLPADVSYYLALIDTSTNLLLTRNAGEEYFSYLVAKYLIRTLYGELYFEKNLLPILNSVAGRRGSKLFRTVALCKLHGMRRSDSASAHMPESNDETPCRITEGLKLLCKMKTGNDILDQWRIFLSMASKHSLNDLRQDLMAKMGMVTDDPNNRFELNFRSRYSLSLSLGLSIA